MTLRKKWVVQNAETNRYFDQSTQSGSYWTKHLDDATSFDNRAEATIYIRRIIEVKADNEAFIHVSYIKIIPLWHLSE